MTRFLIKILCGLSLLASAYAGCIYPKVADKTISLSGVKIDWPCENTKSIYATSGRYIPRNIIATRMQVIGDRAILALPRLKPGVPFTLGVVSLDKKNGNNKVAPYPCLAMQEEGNCDALQNVVDIFYDQKGLLWVLDTGIVNTLAEQPIQRCSPKVIAFDENGNMKRVLDIGHLTDSSSSLQYLQVDYAADGRPFLYITDAPNRAIIVYDTIFKEGCVVRLPQAVNLGQAFGDVLYINLVNRRPGVSVLYFTYLYSSHIFSIKGEFLQQGITKDVIVDVGSKKNPMVMLGSNGGNILFFRNKGESDVYAWDSYGTPFNPDSFKLIQKGNDCRLATQVVPGPPEIWTLESNFQDYREDKVACSGASVAIHPLVKTC